jgi:hypothetical protein
MTTVVWNKSSREAVQQTSKSNPVGNNGQTLDQNHKMGTKEQAGIKHNHGEVSWPICQTSPEHQDSTSSGKPPTFQARDES